MLPPFPGLCADCAHSQVIDSGRSTFRLCQRGLTDPRYAKYPPLPVLVCPGYERRAPPAPDTGRDADDKLT